MQPQNIEVGIILEPTDIEVVNDVRAFLDEKYNSDAPAAEAISSHFREHIQPGEDGVLDMDEQSTSIVLKDARLACRALINTYHLTDDKLSYMLDKELQGTDEYQATSDALSELEVKIITFGSFATAVERNLELSKTSLQVGAH